MSLITWTPEELSSELGPLQGKYWRAVEAQHKKSTMKLVDSADEQMILELEIEHAKPPAASGSESYDYLLSTPFRYGAPYPHGSRFRRAGITLGVFYCCESPITAMAEMAFARLLFFAESPATPFPNNPAEYSVFAVQIRTSKCLDITTPPLLRDEPLWTQLSNYSFCQELADIARHCRAESIRYKSVRDPSGGANLAVLSMDAFGVKSKVDMQSWHLHLQRNVAWAKCEAPSQTVSFDATLFLQDERLAPLRSQLAI